MTILDNYFIFSYFIFVYMEPQIINNQFCQSCGMPLRFDVEEYLGTNHDFSRSDEYCYYCLKEGDYIVDIPMEQMIDIWVKYTDKYNEYASTSYSSEELRILLNKRLPVLKRWQSAERTRTIHFETINKVKSYIDKNLNKELNSEELSRVANLSHYHFRRIFKNITGETVGNYIQRIRLQQTAHYLISTNYPIQEIIRLTYYQTKFSLAKAFKQYFGVSMTTYRNRYKYISVNEIYSQSTWCPEIKKINTQKVICYQVDNAIQGNIKQYVESWKRIIHFKNKYIKGEGSRFISISMDNPLIAGDKSRFYIGFSTTVDIKLKGKFFWQEIKGGIYAVFRYKGNYTSLPELYRFISEKWLPENEYIQKYPMSFEIYLNTPIDTDVSELLTEVYIPIEKQ